jgi:hypothetical protein
MTDIDEYYTPQKVCDRYVYMHRHNNKLSDGHSPNCSYGLGLGTGVGIGFGNGYGLADMWGYGTARGNLSTYGCGSGFGSGERQQPRNLLFRPVELDIERLHK